MIRAQALKHLPGASEGEGGGRKGDVRGEAMKKSRCVRVIEGEEVRRDGPVEYFISIGGQKYLLNPRKGDGN